MTSDYDQIIVNYQIDQGHCIPEYPNKTKTNNDLIVVTCQNKENLTFQDLLADYIETSCQYGITECLVGGKIET